MSQVFTPAYQPLQHICPPWNPATRCMTQWGTAPPEGDQTPDTLADKIKIAHLSTWSPF